MKSRFTQKQKKELVKEYLESGKSQAEFAAEKGIHANTLYKWLAGYRKETNQNLVEVKLPGIIPQPKSFTVRKNGLEIFVPLSFDESEITKILRTVAAV